MIPNHPTVQNDTLFWTSQQFSHLERWAYFYRDDKFNYTTNKFSQKFTQDIKKVFIFSAFSVFLLQSRMGFLLTFRGESVLPTSTHQRRLVSSSSETWLLTLAVLKAVCSIYSPAIYQQYYLTQLVHLSELQFPYL